MRGFLSLDFSSLACVASSPSVFLTLRLRLRAVWLCVSSHCVQVGLSDHALRALFSLAPIRRLITHLLPHLCPLPLPPGSFGPEHPACSSPSLVVRCDLLIFSRFPAPYASVLDLGLIHSCQVVSCTMPIVFQALDLLKELRIEASALVCGNLFST